MEITSSDRLETVNALLALHDREPGSAAKFTQIDKILADYTAQIVAKVAPAPAPVPDAPAPSPEEPPPAQ